MPSFAGVFGGRLISGMRPRLMLSPSTARIAGSSVSPARTAVKTPTAQA